MRQADRKTNIEYHHSFMETENKVNRIEAESPSVATEEA